MIVFKNFFFCEFVFNINYIFFGGRMKFLYDCFNIVKFLFKMIYCCVFLSFYQIDEIVFKFLMIGEIWSVVWIVKCYVFVV